MLQQYYFNILEFLVKLLVYLVNTKFNRVIGTWISFFDVIIFTHISGWIYLKINNRLSFWLEFSFQYVLSNMNALKIPEKNPLNLKLRKHKQLQGIHKIKLMAKEKEMEIGKETVEGKIHNAGREEMWVETSKIVEICPQRMRSGA